MAAFVYRNKNTGQIESLDHANARLEYLQNWETLTRDGEDTPEAAKYKDDGSPVDQFGAGRPSRLLGGTSVGDRQDERFQPPGVFEPPVDPEGQDEDPEPPPVTETRDPDQQHAGEDDEEPTPAPVKELNPADRPARSAPKAAWVDWAVKGGTDRSDAENMTKSELIETYGE